MKTHYLLVYEPEDAVDYNNISCNYCCFYIEDPESCLQEIMNRQEY